MDKRYIVALEIGSSKIKGLAANVSDFGDISVIAVEEAKVNDCVRYGKIQNVQEVSAYVNEIIRKLENNIRISPRKITDIFIALGGRSLTTVTTQAAASFPKPVEITADTVERLRRDASFSLITDKKTLDLLPHAFFVDNSEIKNVVGTIGTQIKAEFSAIVISPVYQNNLDLIKFDNRNPGRHYVIRPTAIADLVLTPSDKQLGCALVDFGAETTTISIYKDDVLQTIVTLPIGSRNITRDLMTGLSMTEERAELAKSVNGSATVADAPSGGDVEINNYIAARAGEIVANIIHQIDTAGFKPQTLAKGIILTGAGSRLLNFDKLLESQAKMPVRIASIKSSLQFKADSIDLDSNIDILAIAKYAAEKSTVNCLDKPAEPQEPVKTEPQPETRQSAAAATRRTVIDDDDLLNDDPDDVVKTYPETDSHKKNNVSRVHGRQIEIDNDSTDEDVADEDSDTDTRTLIERFKGKLSNFWNKSIDEEDDDLDENID